MGMEELVKMKVDSVRRAADRSGASSRVVRFTDHFIPFRQIIRRQRGCDSTEQPQEKPTGKATQLVDSPGTTRGDRCNTGPKRREALPEQSEIAAIECSIPFV